MRTITLEKTLYTFDELSDQAKQRVINEYFSEHWGDDCVINDARHIATLLGIAIDDIHYSGFYSQGDGACFIGTWQAAPTAVRDITSETGGHDEVLLGIAACIAEVSVLAPDLTSRIIHNCGHYWHEKSIDISLNDPPASEPEDLSTWVRPEYQVRLEEAFTDFCRWIYRRLRVAYEHSISDEAVLENCTANEYEFDIGGRLHG